MINRKQFYDHVRQSVFHGKITDSQFEGLEAILNEWEDRQLKDLRWLSYMLATVYHETAHTMQPIEEYGKGNGYKYGRKLKRSGVPYTFPDKIYYGRGWPQLTWFENYDHMGKLLKIDLLNRPELMLDVEVSAKVLFEGMLKGVSGYGDFTGHCLEMYFNATNNDSIGARKIINGKDKADLIAGYHRIFYDALT
jgi:putative chitinase